MRLTFLGTGTSTGVPQIGCSCKVCTSGDPRDNRLRASVILGIGGKNILIDCGPDFRQQILRAGSPSLDALLVTHVHYDHLGGIDDLRPYCKSGIPFPIYCRNDVALRIMELMPYAFGPDRYPGSPRIELNIIKENTPFLISGVEKEIMPLHIRHTPKLNILGFRIGNLGYVTDCKIMPQETIEKLKGIDTLVINALRHESHPSHLNLREAMDVIELVKPRKAYLTHASHAIGLYSEIAPELPQNVQLAYDGLTIEILEN